MQREIYYREVRDKFNSQIQESRKIVADQLFGVSEVMKNFAEEIKKERDNSRLLIFKMKINSVKRQKIILTEKQVNVLKGEAIINTLWSMVSDNQGDFPDYDLKAIKQLIKKFEDLQ